MCFTHTYNIEKAKERLGYRPKDDFERGVRESVEWSLEHDGWAKKLKSTAPGKRAGLLEMFVANHPESVRAISPQMSPGLKRKLERDEGKKR